MADNQKEKNIPVLKPLVFKEELIDHGWNPHLTARAKIDNFFFHSYKEDVVPLKLPLPLHKKTVNDFVLLTKGKMTKTIGLNSFSLIVNHFLFTSHNSIIVSRLLKWIFVANIYYICDKTRME